MSALFSKPSSGFPLSQRKEKILTLTGLSDLYIVPLILRPLPGSDLLMPQAFTCCSHCLECCSLHCCKSLSFLCFRSLLKCLLSARASLTSAFKMPSFLSFSLFSFPVLFFVEKKKEYLLTWSTTTYNYLQLPITLFLVYLFSKHC